jgi:hypothetical protein
VQTPAENATGAADILGKADGVASVCSRARGRPQHLRRCPRFHHLTQHLHRLGERPVGELLIELARYHELEHEIVAKLEEFAEIDPALLDWADGRRWPPAPMRVVP